MISDVKFVPTKPSGSVDISSTSCQGARCRVVAHERKRGRFFVQQIEPYTVGMEREVPRAGAGQMSGTSWEREACRSCDRTSRRSRYRDPDPSQWQSCPRDRSRSCGHAARRVRFWRNCLEARSPRWWGPSRAGTGRTRVHVRLHIRRRPERATGEDRKDRAISAAVVRHQDVVTGGVHAQVGRSPAFGADRVQERELAISLVDRESADRASRCAIEIADLIGDIEMGLGRIERQPGGVGCGHAGGRRSSAS